MVALKNHLGLVHLSGCFIWWAHRDLNTGPTDYESVNIAIKNQQASDIKSILSDIYIILKFYYSLFLLINIY